MVEDVSVFSQEDLWSDHNIDTLVTAFVDRPDLGTDTFYVKLERQMQMATPAARQLMAEMLWVILLFQTRMLPKTKRDRILEAWAWSGTGLDPTHPLLSDPCLQGIGYPGQGYNNWRWKELAYLIEVARSFKRLDLTRRQNLADDPWAFGAWLDGVPMEGYRQFRNILCHLVFPDTFERITVAHDKKDILTSLTGRPPQEFRNLSDLELDKQMADLRREMASDRGSNDFDFYQPDLRGRWKPEPQANSWLLSWNPANFAWSTFDADRLQIAEGQPVRTTWTCANRGAKVGDTAYLVRVGSEPRGVIARGNVLKPPYRVPHYDTVRAEQGEETQSIDIEFTDLRDPSRDAFISTPELEKAASDQVWSPQASGIALSSEAANTLNALWKALPPVDRPPTSDWQHPINEIVFGPPGTGKTYWLQTELLPRYCDSETGERRYEFVTFHQSYSYEDFVKGIRPDLDERTGALTYKVVSGVFKRLCSLARESPTKRYALFIDEINRGNVARIFGELITLIETDKRIDSTSNVGEKRGLEATLPYSGERFGVPANLDIYATMNTADRSIALLDTALRRRFAFRELMPMPELITGLGDGRISDGEGGEIDLRRLLTALNERIAYLLHRDQTIGHAYLMDVRDLADLRRALARQILPLLQELFYEDWGRIRLVFRDTQVPADLQIVRVVNRSVEDIFAGVKEGLPEVRLYAMAPEEEITADAVRKIYEPEA
jgi:5-methylcytosine-specific restriction protein B